MCILGCCDRLPCEKLGPGIDGARCRNFAGAV